MQRLPFSELAAVRTQAVIASTSSSVIAGGGGDVRGLLVQPYASSDRTSTTSIHGLKTQLLLAYITSLSLRFNNRAITNRFTKLVATDPSPAGCHGSGEPRGGGGWGDVRGLLVQRVRDAGADRAAGEEGPLRVR